MPRRYEAYAVRLPVWSHNRGRPYAVPTVPVSDSPTSAPVERRSRPLTCSNAPVCRCRYLVTLDGALTPPSSVTAAPSDALNLVMAARPCTTNCPPTTPPSRILADAAVNANCCVAATNWHT